MSSQLILVSPTSFVVYSVSTLLLYQISKIIYRLFLHPLHTFPGPKLAAATFWYEAYFDVFKAPGGQFIYEIDRLHSIYGPVVRISPEEIHVKDSEWFDVLFTGPGHVRDEWSRANRANGSPGAVASTAQHDLHRSRRGALNPFFSKKAVTELEQSTRSKVDSLCEKIQECANADKVVDLGTAFTAVTLDVITEYCYDACYNCVEEPGFSPKWKKLMTGLFESVPVAKNFPMIMNTMMSLPGPIVAKLNPDFVPFLEAQRTISEQAKAVWQAEKAQSGKHMENDERAKTIFHGIMSSNIPDEEKSVGRLADEAFVLIVAGGETTARVLTVILSYLLQNKDLFNRLRKELDTVVNPDLPESRLLEDIPFMKAVVQEGLRMAAPVTNRPILIAPDENLKCHGWVIPHGTPTSMTLRDVLFDPKIFPDPNTFTPDRWLEAAAQGKRLDRYLVTFSKGTRSCLGLNVAYSEMYLGVAALVSRFDMELFDFDQKRDLDIVRDTFVGLPSKESRGVRVKVQARER